MSKTSKVLPESPKRHLSGVSDYDVKLIIIQKSHLLNSLLAARTVSRRELTEPEKSDLLMAFRELPEALDELTLRGGILI